MKFYKNIRLMSLILFVVVLFIFCSKDKEEKRTEEINREKFSYIKQKIKNRIFKEIKYDIIKKIPLDFLKSIISIPYYMRLDNSENIFLFDIKQGKIINIRFKDSFNKFETEEFIKGIGRGPEEIGRCSDFKVDSNYIYIADMMNGSVKIYKKNGVLFKVLKLNNSGKPIIPYKLLPVNNKEIIINPLVNYFKKNAFFYLINIKNGKIIKSFGSNFDSLQNKSFLYNNQYFSKVFDNDKFYSVSRFLGLVGLYKRDKLMYFKETIDGYRQPKVINKSYGKMLISTIDKGLETSTELVTGDGFIINRAYDRKKDILYWDFYNLRNFNYLFTLKNHPKSFYFEIHNNFVFCSKEEKIVIYNMKYVFDEVRKLI